MLQIQTYTINQTVCLICKRFVDVCSNMPGTMLGACVNNESGGHRVSVSSDGRSRLKGPSSVRRTYPRLPPHKPSCSAVRIRSCIQRYPPFRIGIESVHVT